MSTTLPTTTTTARNGHSTVDAVTDAQAPAPSRVSRRRRWLVVLGATAAALVLGMGVGYYLYARGYESTDDAFIEGRVVQLSPRVSGHVLTVRVDDNQVVKAGDLLAEIDPRDYQAKVDQARAALQAAIARQHSSQINVGVVDVTSGAGVQQASASLQAATTAVATARAQVTVSQDRLNQARAQIAAAQADAVRADMDHRRATELFGRDLVARQDLDHAVADAHMAEAKLAEARANEQAATSALRQAESQVVEAQAKAAEAAGRLAGANAAPQQVAQSRAQAETSAAEVAQARADVDSAELALSYTKVYAPVPGRVTRKAVEVGALVQPGQALMALVPRDFWVVANFKETQLSRMRSGQPVEIDVDAFPGVKFHGHVDSIQSGAGARFSLLPPENATGNFVKVVQRVPVKIVFDGADFASYPLGPGMSVVPTVMLR